MLSPPSFPAFAEHPALEAERTHAQSRHEADVEGIELCVLLIGAFGYRCFMPLIAGRPLDSAAVTCGVIALAAAVLLMRECFERVWTWRSRT